jgi:ABC-type antimicrobial peptide transport system permease subunit
VALGGSLGGIGLCLLLGVLLLAPMNWPRTFAWGPLRISSVSVMAAVGAAVIFVAYICAALSTRVRRTKTIEGSAGLC